MAVAKSTLRILAVERLGQFFNQQQLQLRYTPRKLAIHPDYKMLIIAEADAQTTSQTGPSSATEPTEGGDMQVEANGAAAGAPGPEAEEASAARADHLGLPKAEPGEWASCIRVVDPGSLQTTHCLELDNNEAAMCLTLATFDSAPEEGPILCVGTAKGLQFNPRRAESSYVRVYRVSHNGQKLELLHTTEVHDPSHPADVPRAMCAFNGRLLVGVGPVLRLYDLGKKKLLRKCEYRSLPCDIASIHTIRSRIYVADAQESVHFMK